MNGATQGRGDGETTPNPYHRVLLVDDDPGILDALKQSLAAYDYVISAATDGAEALAAFEREKPDLLLLDLMLPKYSGLEVCQRIRAQTATPIIVLSVKGSEADIVTILDAGADDYLVKPFRLVELLARMRAVLRRGQQVRGSRVTCGELQIDTETHKVSIAGRPVSLTPIEYAVLAELATNVERVVTNQQLLLNVWGPKYADATDYVKGVIRRLRVKLEPDPAHPQYIRTEPHLGYRLIDPL
jgi:two-component system, OmpR family, KDP operon response regulator KdpE